MKDYFVSISSRYDELRGKEILPPLCETLRKLTKKDSRVLDVACGTGLFLIPIATEFDLRLFGSDLSSGMLETAHKKARNDNLRVSFLRADVHNLPFPDEYFDVLISTNAIHHFDLIESLKECARVLRKGGSYIVFSRFREQNDRSFWGKNFPKFADKEDRLYNKEEFEGAAERVEEFNLDNVNELSFEKKATEKEILAEVINKKYSTFDLYSDEEFKESLKSFKNWLNGKKDICYTAEIGEIIYRKV
ncbi:MAG: methyltransferase domain-containing protein [Candidatus Scalinduaceae bacterium]